MTCTGHCYRDCRAEAGGPCTCGLARRAVPSREPASALAAPGFTYCPDCGHAVSEGRACLYCQVRAERQGGCCASCDAQPGPGDTPGAVRQLLASLESRYADAD
jgi:ribosomal protein L32